MNKYFIVATSYYAHTVMFLSEHVFYDKECEFILLEENHKVSDFTNKSVILYDSIQRAVADCDYVWFIDNNLYPGIYGKVCVLSNKYKKKLILSELCSKKSEKEDRIDLLQKKLFQDKPTILSIGIGESCQQYCTEIFLNEMFVKRGVSINQFFSPTSRNILENFAKSKSLNRTIVKQLFNPASSGDVCVKGITFNTYFDLISNINEILNWNTDLTIINLNKQMACNKEVINSLNRRFLRPVYFIGSQYIEVENNIPRTLLIRTNNSFSFPMISDECAINELENKIISELSYPRNSKKII